MNTSITYNESGLTYAGCAPIKTAKFTVIAAHIPRIYIDIPRPRDPNILNDGLGISMTVAEAQYMADSLLAQISKVKLLQE